MRLIDADALKEKFPSDAKITIGHYTFIDNSVGVKFVRETIDDAPTIDAVEVKHGEWKFIGDSEEPYDCAWMCSVCGKMYWVEDSNMVTEDAHYCPNCGAKMDGKEQDDGK